MTAPSTATAYQHMPATSEPMPTEPAPAQAPDTAAAQAPDTVSAGPKRFSGDSLLALVGAVIAAMITVLGGIAIALLSVILYITTDQFDKIDERFDKIDERFAKIDERFAKIDERFTEIDERFAAQDLKIAEVDRKLTAQIAEVDRKLTAQIAEVDRKLTALIAALNMAEQVDSALEGRLLAEEAADSPPPPTSN